MFRFRLILALTVSAGCLAAFAADPPDPVAERLEAAKAAHNDAKAKFVKDINEWLDKREDTARANRDKKAVDAIKLERKAFADKGELPKTMPSSIKTPLDISKKTLLTAYDKAIGDYTATRKDDLAGALEREKTDFLKDSPAPAPVIVAKNPPAKADPRRLWVHSGGYFMKAQDKDWFEKAPGGRLELWSEDEKGTCKEYVQLVKPNGETLRLCVSSVSYSRDGKTDWKVDFHGGKWKSEP